MKNKNNVSLVHMIVLGLFVALIVALSTFTTSAKAPTAVNLDGGVSVTCPHAKTVLNGKTAATCTSTGYTGDKMCIACGEVVERGRTVAKLGHNYGSTPWTSITPTCTATGCTYYRCTRCGNVKSETKPALGHSWQEFAAADGHYAACSRCGKEEFVAPHNCDGENENVYVCTCGHVDGFDDVCFLCGKPMVFDHADAKTAEFVCHDCGTGCLHTVFYNGYVTPASPIACACKHVATVHCDGREPTTYMPGLTAGRVCAYCGTIVEGCDFIPSLGVRYERIPLGTIEAIP